MYSLAETFATALIFCLGLLASGELAADENSSSFNWHYFGTGGLVYVASGQADFVRDISQPDGAKAGQWTSNIDTLIGGQVNFHINNQFEIVGQAVSRHRYDNAYLPELTWAFVKYAPRPDIEFRGGRLGTDFYMRADSRLVGYSYLTVRPSVDYYGGLPYQYFDGLDGALTVPLGEGLLRAKMFGGFIPEKIPLENSPSWNANGSRWLGGSLDYQYDSWQFRVSYAEITHAYDLPGSFTTLMTTLRSTSQSATLAAADALRVQNSTSRHYSAGLVYDEGPLLMQLMVSGEKHDSAFLQDGVAGLLLAGYRLGDITPYAGLSWSKTHPATLPSTGSSALDSAVINTIARTGSDQHTYTLGLRWDFYPDMDMKVQWDAVRGSSDSTILYRWEQSNWNGQTHVLSLALDFAF